jgi:hypothetical protein
MKIIVEPTSSGILGFIATWKSGLLAKLGIATFFGAVGSAIIMAVDGKTYTNKQIGLRFFVAATTALVFTPIITFWLDRRFDFLDLSKMDTVDVIAFATAPIGVITGALAWMIFEVLIFLGGKIKPVALGHLLRLVGIKN